MARVPIPLETNYDSSRRPSSEQRTVNMYRSERGWRQFPGLSEYGNVYGEADGTSLKQESINTNTGGTPTGVWVKPDGLAIYVLDRANNQIDQYSLSSANDLDSTVTYVGTIGLTGTGTVSQPKMLGIKSDGTEILWSAYDGSTNLYVYRWTMNMPWDITTAAATSSYNFGAASGSAYLMGFVHSDGTKLYIGIGPQTTGGVTLTQYTMIAWDVTTLSATSDTFTFGLPAPYTTGGDYRDFDICANDDISVVYALKNRFGQFIEPGLNRWDIKTPGTIATAKSSGAIQLSDGASTLENARCGGLTLFDSGSQLLFCHQASATLSSVELSTIGETGRGAINMGGVLYAVMGSNLYAVDSNGLTTRIGAIDGTNRVVMETDGVQLVITTGSDGGKIYRFTGSTLTTVTDADVEDTAKSSAYLDLAFYLDQADGNLIASANNDATSYDTDDKIEAESFADGILRMYAHNQLLYALGETSIEVFYTSGVGRPPIERQQVIERGIVGTHAITSIDDRIFFVDQFRRPNVMSGLQYQPIYTPALAEEWDAYTTVSDCIVVAYSYRQQTFVEFIFPTDDKSWAYHVDSGTWSEREDSSNSRFRAMQYVNVYDRLVVIDRSNSKIYEFQETAYQDDGSDITRIKDSGLITAEIFGEPSISGNEMICNSLRLTIESAGAATASVSLSKDGNSFAQSRTITLSAGVQTRELVAWGKFREGVFRFTTTANSGVDLIDAAADLEVLSG